MRSVYPKKFCGNSFGLWPDTRMFVMLSSVVAAIFERASSVRNAWCELTMTFGMEIKRARVSSDIMWFEKSSKKYSASSS